MKLKGKHPGIFLLSSALAMSGGVGLDSARGHRDFKIKEEDPDPKYDLERIEKAKAKRERKQKNIWNKCDVCGRIIPYKDIESGKATYKMITPDSDVSYERFETLCKYHIK